MSWMDKISGLQGQLTNQISQIQNSEGLSGLKNQFSQIKEMTKQVIKEATIASEENNEGDDDEEDDEEDGYDSDEERDQEQEERKQRRKKESGWGIEEQEEEADDSDNSFVGEGKERGEQLTSSASSSPSASHHPTSRLLYEEDSEVYDRNVFGEEEEELSFSSSLSPFGSPVKKGKPSASPSTSKAVLHNKASREHLIQLQDKLNASTLQNEKLRASMQEKEDEVFEERRKYADLQERFAQLRKSAGETVDKQRRRSGDFEIDFSDVITSSHADTDAPLRESQRIKQILDSYASLFLSGRVTRNESEDNTNGEADSRALIQTQFQELSQKLLAAVNDRQRDIRGIEERHRAEIEEMKIKYEEDIRTTALAAASARQHSTQVFDEETRRREEQLEEQTKELEEFKNQLEEEANQLQTLKRQFSGEAERLQTKLDESNSEVERMRTEMEKLKIEASQNEKGREEYERKLEEVWQKWAEKERAEMEKSILEYKNQLEAQTPSSSSFVPSQDHIEQLLTSQRTEFQQKEAELQLLLQQAQEEIGKVLGSSSLNDERARILEEELKEEARQKLTERETLIVQLQDSLSTAIAESEERGKRIENLETEKKSLAEERQVLSQRLEHQGQQINEFEELLRETAQRSSLQNQQTEAKMAELEEEKQRLGTQLLEALEGASINIQAAEESLLLKHQLHQLEEEKQKNEVVLRQSFERELREQQLKSQEVLENEQRTSQEAEAELQRLLTEVSMKRKEETQQFGERLADLEHQLQIEREESKKKIEEERLLQQQELQRLHKELKQQQERQEEQASALPSPSAIDQKEEKREDARKLESLVEELSAKLKQTEEQLESWKERVTSFENTDEERKKRIETEEESRKTLAKEVEESRKNLEKESTELEEYKQQLDEEALQLKALRQRWNTEENLLKERLRSEVQKTETYTKQLQETKAQEDKFALENRQLRSELEALKSKVLITSGAERGETESLRREVVQLQDDLRQLVEQRTTTNEVLENTQKQIKSLSSQLTEETKRSQELETKLEETSSALSKAKEATVVANTALPLVSSPITIPSSSEVVEDRTSPSLDENVVGDSLTRVENNNVESEEESALKLVQELEVLKEEKAKLEEALSKSQKELERLRNHLLETEESQTLELLERDDKIKDLQKHIDTGTSALRRLDEKDIAIQELQSKLLALEAECFEKQNDCDRHEQALWNLQSVLEQFQAEQDARIKAELRTIQNELDLARSHSSNLEKEIEELRPLQVQLQSAQQALRSQSEEIGTKSREILRLQNELDPLRRAMAEYAKQLSESSKNNENMIDKRLVTKLFITYFDSSSPSSKADVLKLISSILNLTSEEKAKIGLTPRPAKSWTNLLPIPIPFFGGSASQPTTTQGTPSSEGEKSIADMWVEFLLREAENNASAGGGGAPPPSSTFAPSFVTSASPSSSSSSSPLPTQQI